MLELATQLVRLALVLLSQKRADGLGWGEYRVADLHQALLTGFAYLFGLLTTAAYGVDDLLIEPFGRTGTVPKQGRGRVADRDQHRLGCLQDAADDSDPVTEQAAIGRRMDIGFDDSAISAEFAATSNAQLVGHVDHMIQQLMQCTGLDEVGPAQEGRIIGYGLPVDAAEVPQD